VNITTRAVALVSSVIVAASAAAAIPPPKDVAYPGAIALSVDATDIAHGVYRVRETIPVQGPGDLVLLYPKWIPGDHAPTGPIDRVAGLTVRAGAETIPWTRDTLDVYAFHVAVTKGVPSVDVEFQYLCPVDTKVGRLEVSPEILVVDWNEVVLYPAGYYARRIPVDARLKLPEGWTPATALAVSSTAGAETAFERTSLATLVDSPVRAGRYFKRYDLAPGAAVPVRLDLFAQRPDLLELKPEIVDKMRALVTQAGSLFGSQHYDHYDFLMSLSDVIGEGTTLEHHRSATYGQDLSDFADYDKRAAGRDVIAHEYVHSWDGKFRRPADLWTPSYDVAMQNSLLWVYEGGTQYWGWVLTARAGLWTPQEFLDRLAMGAAGYDTLPGRSWRALQDTTNDEIINPRRPMSWESWQRFEDYYGEGALIWLDADTLIRERSKGARSLDDFARAFFGVRDGSWEALTYTFDDVVKALDAVEPYDWATFLKSRLDRVAPKAPLDGLTRGGYKLVYTDTPSDLWKSREETACKCSDLSYSLGFTVDKDATLKDVRWGGPAFDAGLVAGTKLIAVDGIAYDKDKLVDAIKRAKGTTEPLELIVRNEDRFRTVRIDYHDGLRYPHLERVADTPARLDEIAAPRK
jgi:predicted metalloprotease with PDZ domain